MYHNILTLTLRLIFLLATVSSIGVTLPSLAFIKYSSCDTYCSNSGPPLKVWILTNSLLQAVQIPGRVYWLCILHIESLKRGEHLRRNIEMLIERIGQKKVDWLESYHEPIKYTCDQLINMRKLFSEEVRKLEQGFKPSREWRLMEVYA